MAEKVRKGKKKWIRVLGPTDLKDNILGESYVYDANTLLGKTLTLNLGNLTGAPRRQNTNLKFKISEIKGSDAHAVLIGYVMVMAHVKRMVRTGKEKIDDSFVINCKDKGKLKIKPVLITKGKASNSVLTKLRLGVRDMVSDFALKNDYKTVFDNVMSGQLQRTLRNDLKKIYPLIACEIRKLEIMKS